MGGGTYLLPTKADKESIELVSGRRNIIGETTQNIQLHANCFRRDVKFPCKNFSIDKLRILKLGVSVIEG